MVDQDKQISIEDQHSNHQQFGLETESQGKFLSPKQQKYVDSMKFSSQGEKQIQQRYAIKLNGLQKKYFSPAKARKSKKSSILWQNNVFFVIAMFLCVVFLIIVIFCCTEKSVLIQKFPTLKLRDHEQPSQNKEQASIKHEDGFNRDQKIIQQSPDGVQWPVQNQPYHIYNEINSQLVLDVMTADDGYKNLILYRWKNSSNQKYHFKKVYDNFYHIYYPETKEYMKKSQKFVQNTGAQMIEFALPLHANELWEFVPATKLGKNAFYILSAQKQALDLNRGYSHNGEIVVLHKWNKNDNQVWFLRRDQQYFPKQDKNQDKYEQKASYLLNYIATHQTSINECITIGELRMQMNSKQMIIPYWMKVPSKPNIKNREYSQMITAQFINRMKGNQEKVTSTSQNNKEKQSESPQQQNPRFFPKKIGLECAKNHTVAYIWYGQKQMPEYYAKIFTKCKNNTKLLTEKDYFNYARQWNELQPRYTIQDEGIPIRQRVNLLKLLYLYFESGIYADLDTQINEKCFQNVMTDEVIFTNRMYEYVNNNVVFDVENILVPEESFIMVLRKYNPQIKRMIQEQIMERYERGGRRWRECKKRQCLILQCQRHYRDNTYKKGYD